MQDDEKAKAEYAKALAAPGLNRQAHLGQAAVLADQRHFEESNDLCEALLAEDPDYASAVVQLARNLSDMSRGLDAEARCRSYLQSPGRTDGGAVQIALGRILRRDRNPMEATDLYETLTATPTGRTSDAFEGLALAEDALGRHDRARPPRRRRPATCAPAFSWPTL